MNSQHLTHRFDLVQSIASVIAQVTGRKRCARRSKASPGFTLIEVSLSIGLLSFSLLALIGMVPSGLGSLRDSMDQTTRSQIIQRISSDLVLTDFATMSTSALYFDQEGQSLKTAAGACYRAELIDIAPTLPGLTDTDQAGMHAQLKCIRIGIQRVNESQAAPVTHWYSLQVAKR